MKLLLIVLGLVMASPVLAAPLMVIDGTIAHTLNVNQQPKHIKLLKIALSKQAKTNIKNSVSNLLYTSKHNTLLVGKTSGLPSHVQLGMNRVPVLDQGAHGTCVAFAVTAALDALIGEDYISQVCTLTLGNYIANNATNRPSGWNGSTAAITLARIDEYGIVSKAQQQSVGCGGLTEYPKDAYKTPENEMSIVDYHHASDASQAFYQGEDFFHTELLSAEQRLLNQVPMSQIEINVKTALYQGDRVLMGVLLPMNEYIGLEGQRNNEHDSWVLTGRTEYLAERALWDVSQWNQWGGHELIITGYDDSAVAIDGEGQSHQGLFTLRNSWGQNAGDHGTFYMSYDYFRALVIDLTRIGNLKINND